MHIYRAEDGELFQVNKTLQDIERYESLNNFLHDITGVDETAVLAYLSDGRRLRDDNLRELAGASDQAIFVFNRHYLDYELEEVLLKLHVEPLLQEELTPSSENIDRVASIAIKHYDTIMHLASSVRVQHDALRIASTSLDLHVLSISDVFETLATSARRELERQSILLNGLEFDLDIIGKIRIHPEFLSPSVRRAVESGEKARTLGDYVSNVKMRQVGEACARIHNELRKRFGAVEDSMTRLSAGANDVRSSFVNSGLVYETELGSKRAQEVLGRITEVKDLIQGRTVDDPELLNELGILDKLLRDEVQLISEIKNKSTALCIRSLRHISRLNNDLVTLPQMLSNLQADFRVKTNFTHIERLHKMLYAYGATLVEIVRRKEFSRFFSQRAQMIAEIMAKLSSNERKQRQIYRGEVLGQLPFDLKNMDDPVPSMEITSTGATVGGYSIERTDIMVLLEEFDRMEQSQNGEMSGGTSSINPLTETRTRLEKLIIRMDNLEMAFDKMAEKTIFSSSRLLLPSKQTTEHTDSEFQELVEQFHDLQDAKSEQERHFEDERLGFQTELDQLHAELREAHAHAAREGHLVTDLEDQLAQMQQRYEEVTIQLQKKEPEESLLIAQLEEQRKSIADFEETRVNQENTIERLKQELLVAKSEAQQNKKLEAEASSRLMQVLSTKELISQTAEEIQAREKKLLEEHASALEKIESLKRQLSQNAQENEEKLRAQALESDRILRDVIAEADGDRGVLEHQCFDLAAKVQKLQRECEGFLTEKEALSGDISGLQEELQRMGHQLDTARQTEQNLRKELNYAKEDLISYKVRLDRSEDMSRKLLHVATSFRDVQCKAHAAAAQSLSSSSKSTSNLAESVALTRPFIEPTPVRPDDIAGALQILSQFDTAPLVDAISKLGTTIRKWQKQCKEYRDRAKGKITFRNFAKGDLALFLPTRNSVSKPWAAFNVSFPHYFLSVNAHLSEQLKTREWIVARITSITEQIVDIRDPSTNPYGLSDGIKFYMIQVEDWTQSNSRRKSSPPQLGSENIESHEQIQAAPTSTHVNAANFTGVDVEASLPLASPESPKASSQATANPLPRNLLGHKQQANVDGPITHSSPSSSSFLARLLTQGTTAVPPIEEVIERSSPSPPRAATPPLSVSLVRRSSSPLARVISRAASPVLGGSAAHPPSPLRSSTSPSPTSLPKIGSPHRRSSSLVRGSSPLISASRPRQSPILSTPPRSRPSSPLASPAHAHAHVITSSPLAARASLPSPFTGTVSLPEISEPSPGVNNPSPVVEPSSVVSRSSSKLGTTAHSGSRRSSSSSKPSVSSLFSAGRSPLTMTAVGSGSAPKAPPTTALSNAVPRPTSMLIRPSQSQSIREHSHKLRESVDSTEGGSPTSLLERRRTVSTSSTARNSNPNSPRASSSNRGTGGTQHSRAATEQDGQQGSNNTGAASWSFRRKSKRSSGDVEGAINASGNSNFRRGASDILKRYDDILPQERGSR